VPVDLSAIRNIALLTVEGENDDISGVGQTEAAQHLCVNIPSDMRAHYMQPKVGHYGVFNGSRFRAEIAPRISDFVLTHGRAKAPVALKAARKPADTLEAVLLSAPSGVADDLKLISGIGPKLEQTLNALGIFHFWQVAGLTEKQIAELDDRLAFKGRIGRDRWVEQAKRLAKEAVGG